MTKTAKILAAIGYLVLLFAVACLYQQVRILRAEQYDAQAKSRIKTDAIERRLSTLTQLMVMLSDSSSRSDTDVTKLLWEIKNEVHDLDRYQPKKLSSQP